MFSPSRHYTIMRPLETLNTISIRITAFCLPRIILLRYKLQSDTYTLLKDYKYCQFTITFSDTTISKSWSLFMWPTGDKILRRTYITAEKVNCIYLIHWVSIKYLQRFISSWKYSKQCFHYSIRLTFLIQQKYILVLNEARNIFILRWYVWFFLFLRVCTFFRVHVILGFLKSSVVVVENIR